MAIDHSSHFEKQSVHNLVTSGVSVVIGFVISVILARTLGPAGRGLLDLAGTSTGLFTLVLSCSIPSAITHLVARQGGVPRTIALGIIGWGLGAGILTGVGLLFFPEFSLHFGLVPSAAGSFWPIYIVAMVILSTWTALLRSALIGRHALISVNRIEVACKFGSLGIFAILALFTASRNAAAFALAAASVGGLNAVASLFMLRGSQIPTAPGVWNIVLATALPLHAANVLHFLNQRIDVFFVQSARGTAEVGVYALAVSLAQFVLLLSSAFALPLLPKISAERDATVAAKISAQVCRVYTALGVLAAAGLALTMPLLLPQLFGRAFSPSLPLLLILLPGVVASGLTSILVSFFVGTDHPKINLFVAVSAATVTVAGNAFLTPRLGALGAALTSTACYILSAILSVMCFTRVSGLAWHQLLWPGPEDWRTMARLAGRFRP